MTFQADSPGRVVFPPSGFSLGSRTPAYELMT
jgi:hypothetical protein